MSDIDFELPEPVEIAEADLGEVSGGQGLGMDPNG